MFILVVVGLLVAWLAVDTSKRPEQLISFGGICMFIVILFLSSAHRTAVRVMSLTVRGVLIDPFLYNGTPFFSSLPQALIFEHTADFVFPVDFTTNLELTAH